MCFMSMPKAPAPPPLPPPAPEAPRLMDQANVDARNAEVQRSKNMRGSASTVKALEAMGSSAGLGGGKSLMGQ